MRDDGRVGGAGGSGFDAGGRSRGTDAQLGETTPRREIQDPDGLCADGVVSVSPGWVDMASAVYRESR